MDYPGIAGGISSRVSSTADHLSSELLWGGFRLWVWIHGITILLETASHSPRNKTALNLTWNAAKLLCKNLLNAVEKLIRRCHNVDNLSDRSQDVHINTQMLNGWRMSEWEVAPATAKIHSSRKQTQVHTPGTATAPGKRQSGFGTPACEQMLIQDR